MKIIPYKEDLGQMYSNPFKENNIYPFSKIGRVVTDTNTGEIKYRLHDYDSTLDENGNPISLQDDEDIMVYFPAFYCKRTWSGTTLKDEISSEIPTIANKDGWSVHTAFLKEDGSVRPYVLVGAFQGIDIGGQLRSVPNKSKPKVSITIDAFRNLARKSRDNKFNIMTIDIIAMIQMLYKIAFQDLNSQKIIGNGWTAKSESASVGSTMKLGNRSGYLGVNGNQISLFGIEDFYGNVWDFTDGIFIKDDGYYFTHIPNKFGTISNYDHIAGTPSTLDGYIKNMTKIDGVHQFLNIPKENSGASETTYYTDHLWGHDTGEENICLFGAIWDKGARSGAFCFHWSDVASRSGASVGARLCVLV